MSYVNVLQEETTVNSTAMSNSVLPNLTLLPLPTSNITGYYVLLYTLSSKMLSMCEVMSRMYIGWSGTKINKIDESLRCFCYNMIRAVKLGQSKVSFSSDRNRYNNFMLNGTRINTGVGYEGTQKVVDMFVKEGFLQRELGYKIKDGFSNKSKSGYLILTQKMVELVEMNVDLDKIKIKVRSNVLTLRDDAGNDLEFTSTKYTKEIISVLNRYNKMMDKTDVVVDGVKLDTGLARIFNVDFDHGGRLYTSGSSYQGLSPFMRNKILINGQQTAEVDIKGSHISILHTMSGSRLLDGYDPYDIPMDGVAEYDVAKMSFMLCQYNDRHNPFRNLVKLALLIMVNANHYKVAEGALCAKIAAQIEKTVESLEDKGDDELSLLPLYGLTNIDVKLLFKRIKEKHKVIKEYFFSGAGVWLQKMEGDIFTKVIDMCIHKDYPVLVIHDSCRADVRQIKEIGDFITAAWYEVVGDVSNLKLEYEF